MADAALEIYKGLNTWKSLVNLIDTGESEGLHLECKSPTQPKLTQDHQAHLSKALSGFSNTAGGILIYGISTTTHGHSGLDILSQLEPIGMCKNFQQQLQTRIPSLTSPPIFNYKTKVIKQKSKDEKGIIICYIPKGSGDPVQVNKDNNFYYRSGHDFTIAPYEMIKRLFLSSGSPDLEILLNYKQATISETGKCIIPIYMINSSFTIGEHVFVSAVIQNSSELRLITITRFKGQAPINNNEEIFDYHLQSVIHKGLYLRLGTLNFNKDITKPKLALQIRFHVYAKRMEARAYNHIIEINDFIISGKLISKTKIVAPSGLLR